MFYYNSSGFLRHIIYHFTECLQNEIETRRKTKEDEQKKIAAINTDIAAMKKKRAA